MEEVVRDNFYFEWFKSFLPQLRGPKDSGEAGLDPLTNQRGPLLILFYDIHFRPTYPKYFLRRVGSQ